jgi:hypothetical protein
MTDWCEMTDCHLTRNTSPATIGAYTLGRPCLSRVRHRTVQ